MACKRHLFLTGEKQVGKSTLLRELIRREGLSCGGFETRPLTADGVRRGFLLHSLLPMPPYENDCVISVRLGERRSVDYSPHNGQWKKETSCRRIEAMTGGYLYGTKVHKG